MEIQGLTYIQNFISREEEISLLDSINKETWLSDLKRRVQHYGYKYDYKKRNIDNSMYLGELPSWTNFVTDRMSSLNLIDKTPDQLIVNEYLAGQGISNHIDCEPCFGDTIISVSLGSSCIMNFKNENQTLEVFLEPCSIVILKDDARFKWSHGIASRKKDKWNNNTYNRNTRISLTFRETILNK